MKRIHFYAVWTFCLQHAVVSDSPMPLQCIEMSITKRPEEQKRGDGEEENSHIEVKVDMSANRILVMFPILIKIASKCP